MKKAHCLAILLLADIGVCIAQTEGKGYDFLGILNSMPLLPENTITAGKAEKEAFKEKLNPSNEWLWDIETKIKNQSDVDIPKVSLRSIDGLQKEFDILYKPIDVFLNSMMEKEATLQNKRYVDEESLEKLNAPHYEQLKSLNKKPKNAENIQLKKELLQKVYANKLSINKNLEKENREIIRQWLSGLKNLAPAVAKLEAFSKRLTNNGNTGIILLRDYYKRLENMTYFYNVGSYEESSTSDIYRYIHPEDFNDTPSNLMNSMKLITP